MPNDSHSGTILGGGEMLVDIKSEDNLGKEIWVSGSAQPCSVNLDTNKITFKIKPDMSITYPLSEFLSSEYGKAKRFFSSKDEALQYKE